MASVVPAVPNQPFRIEFDADGERLVIPIRRSWRTVALATGAAILVAAIDLSRFDDPLGFFDILFGICVALTFLAVIVAMLSSLLGREIIQVSRGMLIHRFHLMGLRRQTSYRIDDIRALTGVEGSQVKEARQLISVLSDFGKSGRIKFDYGDKSKYLGLALDEGSVEPVIVWLARRLPRSAIAL